MDYLTNSLIGQILKYLFTYEFFLYPLINQVSLVRKLEVLSLKFLFKECEVVL